MVGWLRRTGVAVRQHDGTRAPGSGWGVGRIRGRRGRGRGRWRWRDGGVKEVACAMVPDAAVLWVLELSVWLLM